MNNNMMAIKQGKRARGEILALLYTVHPTPAEVRTITNTLLESGYINTPDIASHIDYLTGKGYVTIIEPEIAAQFLRGVVPTTTFIKLSPHGIDLVEHTIEDPGVDV